MRGLGLRPVRGAYHQALKRLLLTKYAEKAFTQESLALVTELDQTTVGQYLKPDGKAGTFDLDEAHAALDHIGSSLRDFIVNPALMPARRVPPMSRQLTKLLKAVAGLTESDVAIVVATAQSVRARARRDAKTQSRPPHAADRGRVTRKTGGKR